VIAVWIPEDFSLRFEVSDQRETPNDISWFEVSDQRETPNNIVGIKNMKREKNNTHPYLSIIL
jgi:hypothetical protein